MLEVFIQDVKDAGNILYPTNNSPTMTSIEL